MLQQLDGAMDGGQRRAKFVRSHRDEAGLHVVERNLLLQGLALAVLSLYARRGVHDKQQGGVAVAPLDHNGGQFEGANFSRLGDDAKAVVLLDRFTAQAALVALGHLRHVVGMQRGREGLAQQELHRVSHNANHAGVYKHHASVLHHQHAHAHAFNDQAVTLFGLANLFKRLVALNGRADMVGHKAQHRGVRIGIEGNP